MGKGSKKKSTEQNDLQLLQALQQQTSVLDNAVNNGWYDEIPVLQNQGATNVAPFSRPNTSQRDEEHNAFVQNKNASRMTQAEKDARSGSIPVLENMTDKDREKVSNLQKQQDYYNNFSTGDAGVDEAMGTSIADSNKRKQNKIDEIQNQKLASSYDDDATIDEWLGREMTDSEVESAKKLVNDYEKQNINAITPEQKRKAEQMSALKDKTSKVESAIYGSMNATPGVDALLQAGDKQYYGWTNEDLANEVKIKNPTLSQEQTDAISQIDEQINALKESKPLTTGDVGVDEAEAMKHANDVTEKVKNLERQKYIVMLGDQFDDSYGYKARKEDAQEQNMGSYLAGDMATRVAETALVQSALKGTGIENTLEGVFGDSIPGKIATDVTKDMPVDVLTDTLPEYLSNKASGMSDDEVNKRLVMNLALNLGINVGVAGLQNLDEIKQAIRTTLPEKVASGEVTEDVAKQIEEMVAEEDVVYHSGTLSRLNKSETRGMMSDASRDTGYYGTGHYFVDNAHRSEIGTGTSYGNKPYSSVDITKAGNLYRASDDNTASALHRFSQDYTRGVIGRETDMEQLFDDYNKLFPDHPVSYDEFVAEFNGYKDSEALNRLENREDSVFTQFMKDRGYNGVDTRGTRSADTSRGVVIYDLPEDSVLQSNVTDEATKNGLMNTRVRNEGQSVFDTAEDERIQGIIDGQSKEKKIAEEYRRIYDESSLNQLDDNVKALKQRFDELGEGEEYYNAIINLPGYAEREARARIRDFKSFGIETNYDEELKAIKESAQSSLDEIKLKREEIQAQIDEAQSLYDAEYENSVNAYKQARNNIEGTTIPSPDEIAELEAEMSFDKPVVDNIPKADDDYLRSLEELTPEGRPEIPELSQAEIDNALSSNDVLVEEAKKSEGAYKGRKNSVKGKILDDVEISNPFGKKTTVNDELNTLVNMFGTNSNNEDVWALKDLINQFNQTGDERFYREAMRMANQMDESFAGSTYVGGFDSSRGISSKNHPTTYTFGEQSSTFSSLVNEATRGRYAINMPNTESVIKQLPLSEEGAKRIRQNASILGNVNSTKEQVDQAYRDLIDTVRKENIDKESQSLIMDTIQSERDGIEGMIDGVSDKTLRDAPEIPRFDGVEEETQPITTLDERYQNIADNVSEEPRTTVNLPEEPIKQLEPDDPKLELSKARSNTFERDNISDTFQKLEMDEDIYLYAKQEEKASLEQAAQKLQDFDACEKEYLYGDLTDKEMGAVDGDTMFGMYKKYCNDQRIARQNGDTELANALQSKINAITKKIQVKGTKAGQFIQSFAKYTRDSDGVILQADILNSKRAAEIASSNPRMAGQAKDFVDDLTKTLSEEDYLWGQLEGSIPLDDSIDITEGVSAVRTKFSEQDAKIRLNQEIQKAIGKVKNKTLKKNLTRNIDQMTDSVYKAMKEGEDIYDTLARYEDIGMTGSLGLTDEARDTVQDLLYKAQSLPYESKERVDLEDEAFSIIADSLNVTGTWKDKINSMRYFAMLFNPKTHKRNITGNVSWQGITDVKDNLAAVIEGVVDKATKGKAFESTKYLDPEVDANRTKSILNRFNSGDRELLKSSKENADRVYRRLVDGNKYYSTTSSIESNKKVFKSNVLNKLTDFNGKALNKEDELALYSKYSKSLAGYLKANGVDSSIFSVEKELDDLAGKLSKQGTDQFEFYSLVRDYMDALKRGDDVTELVDTFDDMVKTIDTTKTIDDVAKDINNLEVLNKGQEYAINEAKKAAFHQESKLADALGEFSRKMGDGNAAEKAAHIVIEGTLPFKKTPINILKSAAAYSPLEGAKVLKDIADLHAGRISANTLIDDISKGLTGTGLLVSGALLSKAGILKATDTSDGTQEYSIKVGNGSYTIDNFAPTTLPLLVGASYNETLMNNKGEMDFEDFLNAMTTVSDPLVETTMLQGISNLFKSVSQASSNDEKPLPAFAATVGSNYLTQFVPTELGNIARSIDDTRRSTYTGKKGIANLVGKTINSAKNKIPVLSETSQPYINAWGREEKNVGDNFAERFAYQHLSGGYYQDIDNSPRAVESRRIAEMFGEDYANDGVSTSVYLGGSKHKLTPEELTKYATEAGQAKATIVDALIKSEGYKNSTDQQKADLLKQAYQLGNDIGKSRTFPDYAVDKSGVFDYEDGNIKGIVDDMLTTAMNNAEKDNLKSEGLPVNDTVRRAYQNNDEQTLDTWRAVQEITQEYDHSDANETLVKRYINGGAESVNQYLEAKDTLQSKYGIDSSSEKLINAVVNNDTEYLNTYSTVKNVTEKYGVGTNDTTMGIYNTDGEEGIKKYGEAQQIVENEYGDDMTKKMYDAYNEGGREGLDTYLTLKTYAEDNELSLTEGMQKVYANMSDKGLDTYKGIMQNEHPKDSSKGNDAYDNLIPYLQASGLSTKEKGQMIYSLKEPNKSTQQYFDSENYSKIWEFYRKKYLKK